MTPSGPLRNGLAVCIGILLSSELIHSSTLSLRINKLSHPNAGGHLKAGRHFNAGERFVVADISTLASPSLHLLHLQKPARVEVGHARRSKTHNGCVRSAPTSTLISECRCERPYLRPHRRPYNGAFASWAMRGGRSLTMNVFVM